MSIKTRVRELIGSRNLAHVMAAFARIRNRTEPTEAETHDYEILNTPEGSRTRIDGKDPTTGEPVPPLLDDETS